MLYHNNRDGSFSDVTARSGLRRTGWASALTVGDYDNDGFLDLFVSNLHTTNMLYRNTGNGTFQKMTGAQAGPIAEDYLRFPVSASWVDFDGDGNLEVRPPLQHFANHPAQRAAIS